MEKVLEKIQDSLSFRDGESKKDFACRLAKTALRVSGYVLAFFAGLAILASMAYTIPYFMINPASASGAWETLVISNSNLQTARMITGLTVFASIVPTYCWYKTVKRHQI